MIKILRVTLLLAVSLCNFRILAADEAKGPLTLDSPNGQLRASLKLNDMGRVMCDVRYRETLIVSVAFGLRFADSELLQDNLSIIANRRSSRDETYKIPVGKASSARDHHNELIVSLEGNSPLRRRIDLAFRAFDDGVAFRYLIPMQESLREFVLADEHTRFLFPTDPEAKALPLSSYTTPYEWYYETKPLSELQSDRLIGLPILLKHSQNTWLAVTEADLTDYAGMYLSGVDGEPGTVVSKLSPLPGRKDGAKVLGKAPHSSPWRVLMVGNNPGRLIESHLVITSAIRRRSRTLRGSSRARRRSLGGTTTSSKVSISSRA
jgi:alpha-glucosidase